MLGKRKKNFILFQKKYILFLFLMKRKYKFKKNLGDWQLQRQVYDLLLKFMSQPESPIVLVCVFRQLPLDWTDYLFKAHPDSTDHRVRLGANISEGVGCSFFSVPYNPKNALFFTLNLFQQTFFIGFTGTLTICFI